MALRTSRSSCIVYAPSLVSTSGACHGKFKLRHVFTSQYLSFFATFSPFLCVKISHFCAWLLQYPDNQNIAKSTRIAYLRTIILSRILFVKMLLHCAILNYKTSIERCVSVVWLFSCQVVSFLPCLHIQQNLKTAKPQYKLLTL